MNENTIKRIDAAKAASQKFNELAELLVKHGQVIDKWENSAEEEEAEVWDEFGKAYDALKTCYNETRDVCNKSLKIVVVLFQ